MKTLILHPEDYPSTTFLKNIYANLKDKTVITGGITKAVLRNHILSVDRILCLGHGSSSGLFSSGQFPDYYIIDDSMADCLRTKTSNIFIWCNADQYVHRNGLTGFYTGMFLSQIDEALMYDFPYTDDLEQVIDESNVGFSSIVGRHINEPLDVLYRYIMRDYGILARTNRIAKFNHERLYLSQPQPDLFGYKVVSTL